MGNFDRALQFVLQREGAYSNHPNDRGGPTQYGITQATFNSAKQQGIISNTITSVRELTLDDARKIYDEMYWDQISGDTLPDDLSVALFDTAVNMGVATAIRMLQRILNVTQDGIIGPQTLEAIGNYQGDLIDNFLDAREERYRNIVQNNSTQSVFLTGWLSRVDDLRRYINDGNLLFLWVKNFFQNLYNDGLVKSQRVIFFQ